MTIDTPEISRSIALSKGQIITEVDANASAPAFKSGARGALVVAGISVALLFIGWLAFYFLLFIPRGPIG
jgi:hypothetical protein